MTIDGNYWYMYLSKYWYLFGLPALVALVVIVFGGCWWLWWFFPKRQAYRLGLILGNAKARADVEDNFRKTIGQLFGGIMRSRWNLAQSRAALFDNPLYRGLTGMRFRPFWSEERKAQPIHSFCWFIWTRGEGEPVERLWP